MPLHDFKCDPCSIIFEELVDLPGDGSVPTTPCPTCSDPAPRIFITPPGIRGVETSTSKVVYYEHQDGRIGIPAQTDLQDHSVKKRDEWYRKSGFKRKEAMRDRHISNIESRLSEQSGAKTVYNPKEGE